MAKFKYQGPPTAIIAPTGDGEQTQEVLLHPGAEVELPQEWHYTRRLVSRGLLVPVEQAEQPKSRRRNQSNQTSET